MKTILKTIISSPRAIIKRLFPSPQQRLERKILKHGDALQRRVLAQLTGNVAYPLPAYRRKVLLHRRLKQYQQVRCRGSNSARVAAIRKMEKEWRKFQRDSGKKLTIDN